MPFLRKIAGNHHNHDRFGSGSSLKFNPQAHSLQETPQPSLQYQQQQFSDVSPVSSKSMHFHTQSTTSKSSRDSTHSDVTTMVGGGYNSTGDLPSPKLTNNNIRRKKPPKLNLEPSKNSARNSIASNISNLEDLNEEAGDIVDGKVNSGLTHTNTTHSSKRTSTMGNSLLSDSLTVFTLDDNGINSPSLSQSDNYDTPLGSMSSNPNSNSNSNSNSRKSSGGNSTNTLSFDKLILSWDPTDPEE